MSAGDLDYGTARRAQLSALLRRRRWRVPIVAGAALLPVGIALSLASPGLILLAAIGPAVALAVLAVAWASAGRTAEDAVMAAWGRGRGLAFVEQPAVPEVVPLLRKGDRRRLENGLVGELGGCAGATICHYTWWERRTVSDGKSTRTEETSYTRTIAALPLPPAVAVALPSLSLHRRGATGGLFDRLESALTSDRVVELESVRLHDRYKVEVPDGLDDLTVRRVFEPSFQVWLEEAHARRLEAEVGQGLLVAWIPDRVRDPHGLDGLADDAARLAAALARAPAPSTAPRSTEATP